MADGRELNAQSNCGWTGSVDVGCALWVAPSGSDVDTSWGRCGVQDTNGISCAATVSPYRSHSDYSYILHQGKQTTARSVCACFYRTLSQCTSSSCTDCCTSAIVLCCINCNCKCPAGLSVLMIGASFGQRQVVLACLQHRQANLAGMFTAPSGCPHSSGPKLEQHITQAPLHQPASAEHAPCSALQHCSERYCSERRFRIAMIQFGLCHGKVL